MAGGQMYVLVCDPRQLALYAGQNVRVSGRVTSSGMLIPDRLEAQSSTGDFHELALSLPTAAGHIATERE